MGGDARGTSCAVEVPTRGASVAARAACLRSAPGPRDLHRRGEGHHVATGTRSRRCAALSTWRAPRTSPRTPTPGSAASCSIADGAVVAEGFHRGAGTPHAEVVALAAAPGERVRGAHRGRDPRALQPHGPHRPVRRRPWSRPGSPASSSPRSTPTRPWPPAGQLLRAAGRRRGGRGPRRGGRRAQRGMDLAPSRRGRPVRDLEVGGDPGRAQRRGRRHAAGGSPAAEARARRAPAACRGATPSSSVPAPRWSTTRSSTVRDADGQPLPPDRQPLRVVVGLRELPPKAHLRDDRAATRTAPRPTTRPRSSRRCTTATIRHVLARGRADARRRLRPRRAGRRGRRLRRARCCSAPAQPRWATPDITTLDRGLAAASESTWSQRRRRRTTRRPCRPSRGGLRCSPGSSRSSARSSAVEPQTDAARLTRARAARHVATPSTATRSPSTASASRWSSIGDGAFTADVMQETLDRSSLGALVPGSAGQPRAAASPWTARLGGHLVQGHVDGTGTILERVRRASTGRSCGSRCPPTSARYVVEKGSITVDGVSLTVVDVRRDDWFSVSPDPDDARAHHARRASRSATRSTSRSTSSRSTSSACCSGGPHDHRNQARHGPRRDPARPGRGRRRRDRARARPSSSSTTRTARTRAT